MKGYTTVPNEDLEVDNCHVIGIACGDTEEEALAALLADNPWILPAGFNPNFFICRQLASHEPLDFEPPEPALMYGPPETMFSPRKLTERRLRKGYRLARPHVHHHALGTSRWRSLLRHRSQRQQQGDQ